MTDYWGFDSLSVAHGSEVRSVIMQHIEEKGLKREKSFLERIWIRIYDLFKWMCGCGSSQSQASVEVVRVKPLLKLKCQISNDLR